MSFDAEALYRLLPAVYRNRDAEYPDALQQPLRQLINVIAEQVSVLEDSLEQLYENHFVETASVWALPYLGDLLGIRALPAGAMARSPRAEVGHTVAYRRRKGTAPMLELLARDVTGWPARAVEFFERLAATQHLNHVRDGCRSFVSLRRAADLAFLGTPFESARRTVEVRRIEPGRGRWNISNVGLFLWRLRSYPRTSSPLVPAADLTPGDPLTGRRFRFHPLGFDSQLFVKPVTEAEMNHLAEPINVPLPLTRRLLAADVETFHPSEAHYGPGLAVSIDEFDGERFVAIPAGRILVCDLSDALDAAGDPVWNHQSKATADQVAIDPVLGRVVFATAADPQNPPRGTSHHGFSFDLGGGEYGRGSMFSGRPATALLPPASPSPVPGFATIGAAITGAEGADRTIVIADSGRFVESLPDIEATSTTFELRAVDGTSPVILLQPPAGGAPWAVGGNLEGSVELNGLWLTGAVKVTGELGKFTLRHCTLTPGWSVDAAGIVSAAADSFLEISAKRTDVLIENCILPPIRVGIDGVRVHLRNCIVDAGGPDRTALSNLAADGPAGTWRLENCTVIGKCSLDALDLASNCILLGTSVFVRRRQEGCVRFTWLPSGSETRVPRRYQCLPAATGIGADLRPEFTSLQFGHPGYGQLARRCSVAIRTGADDGAEMGAFHDLYQPQRTAHLQARLAEYLRFGLEAGVFFES